MNNSNSRDVQDLIAEFVNASNPLPTEEPLSEEMHEDLELGQEKESAPNDTSAASVDSGLFSVHNGMEVLQKQVEELKEKNLELRQQITEIQMQEAQVDATKPIGADDLRMEFLNFTSAHIQQFNTRIKKTEELIESQISKNQSSSEKKSLREYPVWLFWTNIGVLAMIAAYFIFQIFSSGNGDEPQSVKVNTQDPVSVSNPIAKPPTAEVVSEPNPTSTAAPTVLAPVQEILQQEEKPANTTLTSLNPGTVSNGTSSPFRSKTINTTPVNPVQTSDKPQVNSVAKIEPIQKPVYSKSQKASVPIRTTERKEFSKPVPAGNLNTGSPTTASVNYTPGTGTQPKSKTTASRPKSPEIAKTEVKKPAQTNITNTQSERKSSKEKVFFGED